MIIKCKMCGGDIEFTPGDTYGTCEYCGSTSTIPQAEDESKLNRYNRANHFRRQCEFDKAVAAYEKLLEQDDTDAEAHWGAVLSRYGIEYVEDPVTKKRIPTCHRVQVASILADADYLAAAQHAPDEASRELYRQQAEEIAAIQKGILAISSNEKPYDVFICYKETDEAGQRTHDSQWAQEVYYGLTEQGYKVFFSRITLEDKLGQQYEPYIFAALNSARVMVVIGSRPEYFNAVWVKNEWSRYLALMQQDRKRLLIPCYRGMDPYDLPEELSALQSQDMSKIGFMQDLLRGIKKVLDAEKAPAQPAVVRQAVQAAPAGDGASPGVVSLMKRVALFLEDGDFDQAREYIDRVLDIDPECAPAYAARVCAALGLKKEKDLAETPFLYEDNTDWQKALRFADAGQKAVYEGYLEKAKARVNGQIARYARDCALQMAAVPGSDRKKLDAELNSYRQSCLRSTGSRADGSRRQNGAVCEAAFLKAVQQNDPGEVSAEQYRAAVQMLEQAGDSEAAGKCGVLAEQARQKEAYATAWEKQSGGKDVPWMLEEASALYLSASEYKDAKERARQCAEQAENLRSSRYNTAVKAMNAAGTDSEKWRKARELLNDRSLNGYRDAGDLHAKAVQMYKQCLLEEQEAVKRAEEQKRRAEAAAAAKKKRTKVILSLLAVAAVVFVFVLTNVIIPSGKYSRAKALQSAGKYEEAIAAFEALGDYSDSKAQITACQNAIKEEKYQSAKALQSAGKYEEAISAYEALGDYSDSKEQITETRYQQAEAFRKSGKYAEAYALYAMMRGYKDVDSIIAKDDNISAAAAAARDAAYQPGKYVTYGTYPQTRAGNDSTPIEWLVLAREGDKALLISRYALDCMQYNTSKASVTWETSTMRTWLNSTFINKAFSTAEQKAVVTSKVTADKNPSYSTSPGKDTQDKVFLLSITEAQKYFKNNDARMCVPTDYAIAQGVYTISSYKAEGRATCWWWLRSPGCRSNYAALVYGGGGFGSDGNIVNFDDEGARPALWIDLNLIP